MPHLTRVNVVVARMPGPQAAGGLVAPPPPPADVLMPAPTQASNVVTSTLAQFAPVLAALRAALQNAQAWPELAKRPDCVELFLRLKHHVLAAGLLGQTAAHRAVVEAVARETGISRADFDELASVDAVLLRQGRWLPRAARVQRLALDAGDFDSDSPDPIIRLLNQASRRLPGVKRVDIGALRHTVNALDGIYSGIDRVLDAGAASTLSDLAAFIDRHGRAVRPHVRQQYRELRAALGQLGLSVKQLASYSQADKRMAMLAASALRDSCSDVDLWLQLLDNPRLLEQKGFRQRFRDLTRVGLDAAVWLIDGVARGLHSLTDRENLRSFNINLLAGGGIELFHFACHFGVGLYQPSVADMQSSKDTTTHLDFALALSSPFGNLMASSRGGKKQMRLPYLKVRHGEFSQSIGVGTGLIGGVSFLRDKTFGSGVEVGVFPKVTGLGPVNVRAGANLVVHHPALRVTDRAVASVVNATQAPIEAAADYFKRPDATMSTKELRKHRLGDTGLSIKQAQRVQAAAGRYLLTIDEARRRRLPLVAETSDAYAKLTRGFAYSDAVAVIESFLGELARECEARLTRITALQAQPLGSTAEERTLRRQLRDVGRELAELTQRFNFADTLLQDVFGRAAAAADIRPLDAALLAGAADGSTFAWALTESGEVRACNLAGAVRPHDALLAEGRPLRGTGTLSIVRDPTGDRFIVGTTVTDGQKEALELVERRLVELGVDRERIDTLEPNQSRVDTDLASRLSPKPQNGQRTRVMATLDPSFTVDHLERMIERGMHIARINLSHDDTDEHLGLIAKLKEAARRRGVDVPVAVDLPGPKLRLGKFENPRGVEQNDILLHTGSTVTVTTEAVLGRPNLIPVDYAGLTQDVRPGERILLNDGNVELSVLTVSSDGKRIDCDVVRGGKVWDGAGMNLPDTNLSLPTIGNDDFERLRPLLPHIQQIGVSFARSAADIETLRHAAATAQRLYDGPKPLIIAKIESRAGMQNLGSIVHAADAVMVARGDLKAEMGYAKVPTLQVEIAREATRQGKPVIIATGVVPSMVPQGSTPSQGEADGLHSAVHYLGAEAVMLSRETRSSLYGLEALDACAKIIDAAERHTRLAQGAVPECP